jgi:hypothetical protein
VIENDFQSPLIRHNQTSRLALALITRLGRSPVTRRATLLFLLLGLAPCLAFGAIAIDVTVSQDNASAGTTIVSPAFTTAAGSEQLLAFIATDFLSGTNTSVKSVTGGGLTWSLVKRTNAEQGTSEIWGAFAPATAIGASVTATLSQKVIASMTVMSFSGVNTAGAIGAVGGASVVSGASTASLLTAGSNSLVLGVGNDWDNATARTLGAGQTMIHQYLTSTGDTYWVQRQTNTTPAAGTTVTINDTAPTKDRYNLAIVEVLAAVSTTPTYSVSGTISPSAAGNGATVTLSGTSRASATADVNGNFSFTGLANGAYTLTPTKTGYSFTPPNQAITVSSANQSGVNFTATPLPTWSISGTLSPTIGGAGATVSLSGTATASTVADGSGNYSFTGLADGPYAVTPSNIGYAFTPVKQSVTLNGANITNINFTAATASASIARDITVSENGATAGTTITTPIFTTSSGNEQLFAFIATDYLSGTNTTVKSVSGGGLTWTLVKRVNAQAGSSEIWGAFAPSPLTGISVTAALSQSVLSSITVMSFTGVNTSGAIGAVGGNSANPGAPTASLVTTGTNSLVIGVGNDYDNAIARTLGTGQILLNQELTPSGDTYWVQMRSTSTGAAGTTVTLNDTAPTKDRYNFATVEVLAANGNGPTTPPTVSLISPGPGATLAGMVSVSASAHDAIGVTGLQFFLDGSPLGAAITTPPYTLVWDSSSASLGTHTLAAKASDGAGYTTTSSSVSFTVASGTDSTVVGQWSTPVSLPAVAVNLILLQNNQVLFYQDGSTPTVWNYVQNTFAAVPYSAANLFCSGAAMMKDGRIFVAGGYGNSPTTIGITNAEIFDPVAQTWTAVPDMQYRRWYPNVTTLSDGRMLVTAGWQTTANTNAGISELYDPSTNTWTSLTNANNPFETYPFLYLLPNGEVIHIGGSEYATDTDMLNLNTVSWSVVDPTIVNGGSATMYVPNKFIKAGSASDSQDVGASSNTTFTLDFTQPNPAWVPAAPMVYPRSFMNLTMLPDGTALATGGETDKNGGDIANAVYAAELWSPQTKTWSTMASMHTPREYHGTALLLPDGRVLESGMGADFGNVPNELSAEFYSPPYLFKGTRPAITQAPTQISYNTSFFVQTPDAATITSVVLIRTGAVTHFFDQNERFLPVSFTQTSGGLTVTAPVDGNTAPPGYYMLFIVNSSGIPSIAPFVQLQ